MRVGDKVRLLGWEGECEGISLTPTIRQYVGREGRIHSLPGELDDSGLPRVAVDESWPVTWVWWPLSRVEKVGAEG